MKTLSFHIGSTPGYRCSDYHLGRYKLAKHFGTKLMSSVDVDGKYARQLLLSEPSDFPSGRVALYVCECCGDLNCGALTVRVERLDHRFVWSLFAYEAPYANHPEGSAQSLENAGPFTFDAAEYCSALAPYARR